MSEAKITRFAQAKQNLLRTNPVAETVVHSWQFFPLCADSPGGWASKEHDVLHACEMQLAEERRAAAVTL